MIKIEKRNIELSTEEFREELIKLCRLIKKHSPNAYGINARGINTHFHLKMNVYDFYSLSDELGYEVCPGKFWHFDEILK